MGVGMGAGVGVCGQTGGNGGLGDASAITITSTNASTNTNTDTRPRAGGSERGFQWPAVQSVVVVLAIRCHYQHTSQFKRQEEQAAGMD